MEIGSRGGTWRVPPSGWKSHRYLPFLKSGSHGVVVTTMLGRGLKGPHHKREEYTFPSRPIRFVTILFLAVYRTYLVGALVTYGEVAR